MKIREKVSGLKDSVNYQILKATTKGWLLATSGIALEGEPLVRNTVARNELSEPFDFPSHIGNVAEGSCLTMSTFIFAAPFTLMCRQRENFKRNLRLATLGSFAISTLAQVVGEKYGLHLPSATDTNVTDWLDVAYGTAASALTAAGAYSTVQTLEESLHTISVAKNRRLSEELGYTVGVTQ